MPGEIIAAASLMKSICFFSSYFTSDKIPYYVKYYLEELTIHFTEVILLTNPKTLEPSESIYLSEKNIQLKIYKNEGMDFGMWYKAFKEYGIENYERAGLINDSCVLYKSLQPYFDWLNNSSLDYAGMIITARYSSMYNHTFLQ